MSELSDSKVNGNFDRDYHISSRPTDTESYRGPKNPRTALFMEYLSKGHGGETSTGNTT
jgi:hypothetical protein